MMVASTTMIVTASIIVFLSIILILVSIILLAERKLIPQGDVKILVNKDEEKSPSVKPGGTLLSALSAQNIFLPSACGGGGTCAMCNVRSMMVGVKFYLQSLLIFLDQRLKRIGD